MHPRAAQLIASLGLQPHPEGGHYRETFRSPHLVRPDGGRPARSALTTIYFLLAAGEASQWHRVASDEAWHHLEGGPLELLVADPHAAAIRRHLLGPADEAMAPLHVVPAHAWQAACPLGAYALLACTVGPGFDFADFQLLRDLPEEAEALRRRPWPDDAVQPRPALNPQRTMFR
jgi:predicted cupin superfamily sugar epimerase